MYNWYDKLIGGCFIPTVYLLNSLSLMNALLVAYVYVNALKFIPWSMRLSGTLHSPLFSLYSWSNILGEGEIWQTLSYVLLGFLCLTVLTGLRGQEEERGGRRVEEEVK